jgi:hypothetical protein
MIDPSRLATTDTVAAAKPRPVFRMVDNDRMAGGVPVWDSRPAPAQTTAATDSFADTLSYAAQDGTDTAPIDNSAAAEPFGFFDLLDMINPLQHIPIVSTLYRNITGDDIKPVARIIGGTVFGGPAGGAMSLANVIIEEETGKDITGNVIAMVQGDAPQWRHTPDEPEQRLNNALAQVEREALSDIPPAALAYANQRSAFENPRPAYHAQTEDDRMAGTRPRFRSADDDNNDDRRDYYFTSNARNNLAEALPPREPITRLDIASLPVIYND